MSYQFVFKYIVIGDSNVGKSCIVQRYLEGTFNADLENTIGVEFGAKIITCSKGRGVKLQIWDTAGQEAFQSIARSYYRSSAGALVVFDLTERNSFEHVKIWLSEVRNHANDELSVMIIGNKLDIQDK